MRARYLLAGLMVIALPAFPATYKCQANGQISYGDRVCAPGEGQALRLQEPLGDFSGTALTPEQQLQKEKQQADALRAARLKREKAEEKAREKAAKAAQKAEKKKQARCKALAKSLAKPAPKRRAAAQHAAKREAYARECLPE